jgi:hypothetical protein
VVIDYRALFKHLATISPADRARQVNNRLYALPLISIRNNLVRLIAYEGPIGESPLIYNRLSALERIEQLGRGEVVARKTHALLNLMNRELIVEYNFRGAKATDITWLCETLATAHADWEYLDLSATPKIEPSFLEALNRFRVIKLASVKVARPNQNWNADLKNMLGQMASDSDARLADVTLYASRRGTLSLAAGLVAYIKRMVSGSAPSIAGASISGIREGENSDSTISLKKHLQAQIVRVRLNEHGYVDDGDIEEKIEQYSRDRENPQS